MNLNDNSTIKTYSILSLGDSYTIGESVTEEERFPNQTIALLMKDGINFSSPKIIATTGWTTDELQNAIDKENISTTYDAVTLLIGVNNQYRSRSIDEYREQFVELLNQAITFAAKNKNHVFVLSIPDWGVTPYADGRDRTKIAQEIDAFNTVNKEESLKAGVHYIDITPISRNAATDLSLVANDGLHPSGKMYAQWAAQLSPVIKTACK